MHKDFVMHCSTIEQPIVGGRSEKQALGEQSPTPFGGAPFTQRGHWCVPPGTAPHLCYLLRPGSLGSGDGRNAPRPPLCKGRCRPYRAAEGLFPSGQYTRAAFDYELPNNRAVRQKTMCVAAIPQSASLTAPFTQRGLWCVLPIRAHHWAYIAQPPKFPRHPQ